MYTVIQWYWVLYIIFNVIFNYAKFLNLKKINTQKKTCNVYDISTNFLEQKLVKTEARCT